MSPPPHDPSPSQDDPSAQPVPTHGVQLQAEQVDGPAARMAGQTFGNYRLEERLGGGAHSSVYRAIEITTGDAVALKLLLPGADGVARTRFRHEARMATQLVHPHIVKTLTVDQAADDDLGYIAMELIDGLSLATLLDRHHQLSVLDACSLLGPIAAALGYAHRQGIIHRDVKPSNILLKRVAKGTPGAVSVSVLDYPVLPLLTDFGIALAMDAPELTNVGRTIGTPAYMAPEQCEGAREIDGRADIYSLGSVFYRCLVGRPPFTGTTTQILYAHVYSQLTIPDTVLIELPINVINILRRSLAKNPQDRYATATEMAHDFAQISGQYAAMSQATGVSPDEATRTMSSLPATRPHTDTVSVLVPAVNRAAASGTRTSRTLDAVPAPKRRSSLPIPLLAVGIVLAATFVIVGFGLALRQVPGPLPEGPVLVNAATPLPAEAVADATRNAEETVAVEVAAASTPEPESAGAEDTTGVPEAEDSDRLTVVVGTPTTGPVPTLQVRLEDIPRFLENALTLANEQDWGPALDSLTIVLRTDPTIGTAPQTNVDDLAALIQTTLLDDPNRPFWSDYGDLLQPQQLADMLFSAYVGIGTGFNRQRLFDQGAAYLRAALEIRPEAALVADLAQASQAAANAIPNLRPAARLNLSRQHLAYADQLQADARYCAAFEQLDTSNALWPDTVLVPRMNELETLCASELTFTASELPFEELQGTLIYTTRVNGADRVYGMPAAWQNERPQAAQLLVDDALYGVLSKATGRMAMYSTRSGAEGLFGLDAGPGTSPAERGLRYTRFAEDGADSPASWDPQGSRLAFASRRESDRQSRIYVTWANGEDNTREIAGGTDPVWHPSFQSIVYSGVDPTGNRPGLWLVDSAGGSGDRLTNVETDRRPQWSPGGQYIVFTSVARDGNWEIYRFETNERELTRLTDDPAQDVLPTVSPDGQLVAFLSDRDGAWKIWIVPMSGGEPVVLAPLVGTVDAWERASLQWVP